MFLILIILTYRGGFKRPGLITGSFALGYGISRFVVEYFRVPDPQFFSSINPFGFVIRVGEYGLTMGQSLTLPMILCGLILIVYSVRFKDDKAT